VHLLSSLMLLIGCCIDYLNDPYSEGKPGNAICSRDDLDEDSPRPSGCFDAKVRLSASLCI